MLRVISLYDSLEIFLHPLLRDHGYRGQIVGMMYTWLTQYHTVKPTVAAMLHSDAVEFITFHMVLPFQYAICMHI